MVCDTILNTISEIQYFPGNITSYFLLLPITGCWITYVIIISKIIIGIDAIIWRFFTLQCGPIKSVIIV